MATFKKKTLNELVGGDIFASGNDRNIVSNAEIETGPIEKQWGDNSTYEKGEPTTTDKVFGRYRQNIPWFAVYSFGGTRTGRGLSVQIGLNEKEEKKSLDEKLVDKTNVSDVITKNKVDELIKKIKDDELTVKKIKDLNDIIKK
jgi:hypothetical protein